MPLASVGASHLRSPLLRAAVLVALPFSLGCGGARAGSVSSPEAGDDTTLTDATVPPEDGRAPRDGQRPDDVTPSLDATLDTASADVSVDARVGATMPDATPTDAAGLDASGLDGGPLVILASGLDGPLAIAVDSTNVYCTTNGKLTVDGAAAFGSVLQVSKTGGAVSTLSVGGSPGAIAADGTNVYWTQDGAVLEKPVSGGPSVTLAASPYVVTSALAVDTKSVYWATNGPTLADGALVDGAPAGTLEQTPIGGGATVVFVADAGYPQLVAADSTTVYWLDTTFGFWGQRLAGGTPVSVSSWGARVVGMAIDSVNLYFTTGVKVPVSGWEVVEIPLTGGSYKTLGRSTYGALASDGTNVYATDRSPGSIDALPVGGGPAKTLAPGLKVPAGVALDATRVYFTDNAAGTVSAVGK